MLREAVLKTEEKYVSKESQNKLYKPSANPYLIYIKSIRVLKHTLTRAKIIWIFSRDFHLMGK